MAVLSQPQPAQPPTGLLAVVSLADTSLNWILPFNIQSFWMILLPSPWYSPLGHFQVVKLYSQLILVTIILDVDSSQKK